MGSFFVADLNGMIGMARSLIDGLESQALSLHGLVLPSFMEFFMSADVSRLIASLRSDDSATQQAAAEQLAHMETGAQAAAVALVEASDSDKEEVREWVVAALEGIGPPLEKDIGQLAALLKKKSLDVAYWAATLLGRLGPEAAPAVSELTKAVSTHDELAVRQRAASALGEIGPAAKSSLESLQDATKSTDPRLARLARDAIEQIKD
jgi:HEAT repeat protein